MGRARAGTQWKTASGRFFVSRCKAPRAAEKSGRGCCGPRAGCVQTPIVEVAFGAVLFGKRHDATRPFCSGKMDNGIAGQAALCVLSRLNWFPPKADRKPAATGVIRPPSAKPLSKRPQGHPRRKIQPMGSAYAPSLLPACLWQTAYVFAPLGAHMARAIEISRPSPMAKQQGAFGRMMRHPFAKKPRAEARDHCD